MTGFYSLRSASSSNYILPPVPVLVLLISACVMCVEQQCQIATNCSCYGTELIDCRNKHLVSVPTFLPTNVSYDKLLLSHNNIQRIGASAFTGIRFRKLEVVDNPLQSVSATAFSGLETILTEVVLDLDVTLAAFPLEALKLLTNLTTLKVKNYGQSSLPAGALSGLSTLRELSLTHGNLVMLTASDVISQRTVLEVLDISDNKLREFPTEAIRTLTQLKELNIRANYLDHLGGSFVVSASLRELDISHHALDRAGINMSAFDGVASTLDRLVMSQCHLEDRHAAAITRAAAVTSLIISFNQLTSVRAFLADMPNLRQLDAHNNSINTLTARSLPPARHLRVLDLAYNPLRNINPNAFVDLRHLEDLKLDYAKAAMPLNGDSFASQQWTLRNLNLRGVDLARPQWSVINGLRRLEMISLGSCRLENIPSFTFLNSGGRLHTLQLTRNHIDQLNQTSLVGLESSLARLNLDGNPLTTIRRCTFHGFRHLDAKSLTLPSNTLMCDCELQWFYNWTGNARRYMYWNCADGRQFRALTDSDFQHCNATDDHQPCEDLIQTTPSSRRQALVAVFVLNVTSTSFAVRWTVDTTAMPTAATGFRINCSCAESWTRVDLAVRERRFDGLHRETTYDVCVMLEYLESVGNWTESLDDVSCLDVITTSWLLDPAVMSVIGIVAVLLLVVLPVTLGICLAVRRERRRRRQRLAELAQPKITVGKTKRFMRHGRQSLDASTGDRIVADALRFQSRSVDTNLDTLQDSDEDRYKTLLALRILQSRSLDNLVDGVNAGQPSYFMNQMYGMRDKQEQEVYDEINEEEIGSPLIQEQSDL